MSLNRFCPSFAVTEHVIPGQHIREYFRGSKSDNRPIRLAVKEYRPLDAHSIRPNAATIVAAHGLSYPKELYEPFWEALHHVLPGGIRAIFFADASNHGDSYVLNEDIIGDDPTWLDHCRDLLQLVNHFRDFMIRPIVGVAHSMGSRQLAQVAIWHPRLFDSFVFIEPAILSDKYVQSKPNGWHPAAFSARRPDRWPSRAKAEASLRGHKIFQTWDKEILDAYSVYGLRQLPTALYPIADGDEADAVTLKTTKAQEAWSFLRPVFDPVGSPAFEQRRNPDVPPEKLQLLWSGSQLKDTLSDMEIVRPPVFWIFADKSALNPPPHRIELIERTGVGVGGNGGMEKGGVEHTILKGTHTVIFETPKACAEKAALFLEKRLQVWQEDENWWQAYDSRKSDRNQMGLSELYMQNLKKGLFTIRPGVKGKL